MNKSIMRRIKDAEKKLGILEERKMNETEVKTVQVSQKHIDGMVAWVARIVGDLGQCTIENVAASADKSYSWAANYLRRAVKRGLIIRKNGRPVTFKMPSENDKPDQAIFDETGQNEHLSIYVDGSVCKKMEALAAYRYGQAVGGSSILITSLVDAEFAQLSENADLAKILNELIRHEETMKTLRGV